MQTKKYKWCLTLWKGIQAAFFPAVVVFLGDITEWLKVTYKDAAWLAVGLALIAMLINWAKNHKK